MNTYKQLHALLLFMCLLVQGTAVVTTPTHVYIRNCTSFHFDVSIEYEGTTSSDNLGQKGIGTIAPFGIPEEKNMVLAINRLLPQGEHFYTIKLVHGSEILYLKQKFISQSVHIESELGISIESVCLHDPWFMNSQAKERHEHMLSINGHTIVVVYYAYDTNESEDIEYTLYERFSPSLELTTHTRVYGKTLAYSLAIPIASLPLNSRQKRHLVRTFKPFQQLARTILSSKNLQTTYQKMYNMHGRAPSQASVVKTLDTNTHTFNIHRLEKMFPIVSPHHGQLSYEDVKNGIHFNQRPITILPGQEMIDYIAQKQSWYSVVDSRTTTRFWIPRNRTIS